MSAGCLLLSGVSRPQCFTCLSRFQKENNMTYLYHYYTMITRLSKDNAPASKEHNKTHNECMLHFHKFHNVLLNKKSNQIRTREAAHKIRQLQINIRNLS